MSPTVSGHDDYDPSYYFMVDEDSDRNEYDWSQEQWLMRCLNRELAGLDHYGFFNTPLWIQQGINLLQSFHRLQQDRQADMDRVAREARNARTA